MWQGLTAVYMSNQCKKLKNCVLIQLKTIIAFTKLSFFMLLA